jgi:hypothetical protein
MAAACPTAWKDPWSIEQAIAALTARFFIRTREDFQAGKRAAEKMFLHLMLYQHFRRQIHLYGECRLRPALLTV